MFNQQLFDQLSTQIKGLFETNPLKDFDKNFKAILHSAFEKMDLVTREEFDIQQKVLLNTRIKLDELEKLIKKLEDSK